MADRAPDPIGRTPSGAHPFKFGIEVIEDGWSTTLGKKLIAASARMNDPGPYLRTLARRVVRSQKLNILEQRTPGGAPLAPLKHDRGPGRNPGGKVLFDTGRLYEAINYEIVDNRTARVGIFGVPYAGFVTRGTAGPYFIRPKTKKVLRFWMNGGYVFARSVKHPGLVPRPIVGVRPDDVPTMQQMTAAFIEACLKAEVPTGGTA